jgi:regulator of sigma E protease
MNVFGLLWYVLWFAVAVSLLVTVHEFGHFWVARRLGFKVLRFSVGFGKPLVSRQWGRDPVEYCLAPIPLGGYVKMLDEREGPVAPQDLPRSFTRRPPYQRILVLLAGPAFNFMFAIVVLAGMLWASGVTRLAPVVGDVTAGSFAARAGLQSGDRIVSINGARLDSQRQVTFKLLDVMSGNGNAHLQVSRAGVVHDVDLSVTNPTTRRGLTAPTGLFRGLGFQFWTPPMPAVIGAVAPGGPAARAGLKAGDRILAVDGHPVKNFEELVAQISPNPGKTLSMTYRRGETVRTVEVTTESVMVGGKRIGRIEAEGRIELTYPAGMLSHVTLGPLSALGHAAHRVWSMTALQAHLLWRMLLGDVSLANLSGPLSIAEYAGQSASAGVSSFLGFLVLISLSLGFLNLLPIPILDGGQILFQLIEWVKGGPLSERAQILGQQVGIALLFLLGAVVIFNDIARIARQFN